jgi:hypothetical protein
VWREALIRNTRRILLKPAGSMSAIGVGNFRCGCGQNSCQETALVENDADESDLPYASRRDATSCNSADSGVVERMSSVKPGRSRAPNKFHSNRVATDMRSRPVDLDAPIRRQTRSSLIGAMVSSVR